MAEVKKQFWAVQQGGVFFGFAWHMFLFASKSIIPY
jgi:hypothetical protein